MSTILLCTPLAALWPSMPGPPKFTGPHHVQIEYNGWDLTDFVFNCTILYKKVTADDGARFDVALSFDGEVDEATVKTTTSLDTTVVFNSADLRGHFGTEVGKNWCTFNCTIQRPSSCTCVRQEGYAYGFVCLFVSMTNKHDDDYAKTTRSIFTKFDRTRKKRL